MTKRTWNVVGLDKMLESAVPEERAALAGELEQMLQEFDSDAAPAERVIQLAPGTRECPSCGGALVDLALLPHPTEPSEHALVLECEACDATFFEPLHVTPN